MAVSGVGVGQNDGEGPGKGQIGQEGSEGREEFGLKGVSKVMGYGLDGWRVWSQGPCARGLVSSVEGC